MAFEYTPSVINLQPIDYTQGMQQQGGMNGLGGLSQILGGLGGLMQSGSDPSGPMIGSANGAMDAAQNGGASFGLGGALIGQDATGASTFAQPASQAPKSAMPGLFDNLKSVIFGAGAQ